MKNKMHTIKVFLGSTLPELQETQIVLSDFLVYSVHPIFKYEGAKIEVIRRNDSCLNNISEQLQSKIDKCQKKCNFSVFLFKNEVAEQTIHEFEMAREIQRKQHHLIFVYFFEVPKTEKSKGLIDFQNRLITEGYYWYSGKDVYDLESQLIIELLQVKSQLFKVNNPKKIEQKSDIDKDINELKSRIKKVLDEEKKINTNRKDQVIRLYREACRLAENNNYNKEKQYDLLSDYFGLLREYDLYDEAKAICRRQISISEKLYGLKHEKTANSYNNLGSIYWQQDNYKKALEYDTKALKIRKEVLGEEHPDTAESYNNIGSVCHKQYKFDEALKYHQKALKIREEILGKEHPDTATSYSNIGEVYCEKGEYDEALEYHEKALKIREEFLGKEHAKTADSYNNIGLVYLKQSDYDKALGCYEEALRIYKKDPDTKQPDIAESYNNIGKVFYIKGDFDNALTNDLNALEFRKEILGEEHPDTAESYNNIGKVHYAKDDYDEAMENYKKALKIRMKVYGTKHPMTADSYNNIGSVYWQQGNYKKASDFDTKALKIRKKVLGEDHPDTAESYNNIGSVYYKQYKYDEALKYHEKALKIRKKILGNEHPDTATSYSNIGEVYCEKGEYDEALKYHEKALKIREEILGKEHAKAADSYNNIGLVHFNQGNYSWAREYYKMALERYEKALGKMHPDTASSYNNIGLVYNALNDYPNALEYFNRALQIREEKIGKNNDATRSTQEELNILNIAIQLRDVLQDSADGLKKSTKILLSKCSCTECSLWFVNYNSTPNKNKDNDVLSLSLINRHVKKSVKYKFEKDENYVRVITNSRISFLINKDIGDKRFLRFNSKTPELSNFVSEEFVEKKKLNDFIIIPIFDHENKTKTIAFIELSYKKSMYDDDYWKRLSSKIQREFSEAFLQYKTIKKQQLIEDLIKIHGKSKDEDPNELFQTILDAIFLKYCPAQAASFFIWDTYVNQYKIVATTGLKGELDFENVFYFRGEGHTGRIGKTGEPLIIDDLTQERDGKYEEDIATVALTEMFIPIIDPSDKYNVIGVFRLVNKKSKVGESNIIDFFNDEDVELMLYAADYLALVIANCQKETDYIYQIYKLTHEINAPANAIWKTAIYLYDHLSDKNFVASYLSPYLKNIIEFAELQKWQATTSLFLSRGHRKQSFETRYNIQSILLWDVIQRAIDISIPIAQKYGLPSQNIFIDPKSDGELTINIDKDAFVTIFYNLFTNAIKYHVPEKRNKFYTKTSYWIVNDNLIITVEDNGIGIKAKDRSKIFEMGYRSEFARRINASGYGIGLTVSKQIIEDFCGEIKITNLKKPTVFQIEIPISKIQ